MQQQLTAGFMTFGLAAAALSSSAAAAAGLLPFRCLAGILPSSAGSVAALLVLRRFAGLLLASTDALPAEALVVFRLAVLPLAAARSLAGAADLRFCTGSQQNRSEFKSE